VERKKKKKKKEGEVDLLFLVEKSLEGVSSRGVLGGEKKKEKRRKGREKKGFWLSSHVPLTVVSTTRTKIKVRQMPGAAAGKSQSCRRSRREKKKKRKKEIQETVKVPSG